MSKGLERSTVGMRTDADIAFDRTISYTPAGDTYDPAADERLRVSTLTHLFEATVDIFRGKPTWNDTRAVNIKGQSLHMVSIVVEGHSLDDAHLAGIDIDNFEFDYLISRQVGLKKHKTTGVSAELDLRDLRFLKPIVEDFAGKK